ncbi:MAG: tellurite resistance TerB family protein [Opitutales bacterium]
MSIDKLFGNLASSSAAKGALGGVAGGALASMLIHPKARKKLTKTAVKVGGAAALAGVGYYAYNQWQKKKQSATIQPSAPAPATPQAIPSAQTPPTTQAQAIDFTQAVPSVDTALAMKLIKAMISAAGADGQIDSTEMNTLMDALQTAQLTPEENAELMQDLNNPPTVEAIAALAVSTEEAAELYGAAMNAIDPDTPAEVFYLKRLATALQLDPGLVESLHQTESQLLNTEA